MRAVSAFVYISADEGRVYPVRCKNRRDPRSRFVLPLRTKDGRGDTLLINAIDGVFHREDLALNL